MLFHRNQLRKSSSDSYAAFVAVVSTFLAILCCPTTAYAAPRPQALLPLPSLSGSSAPLLAGALLRPAADAAADEAAASTSDRSRTATGPLSNPGTGGAGRQRDPRPSVSAMGQRGLLVVRGMNQLSHFACVGGDGKLLPVNRRNCPLSRFLLLRYLDGSAALYSLSAHAYCGISAKKTLECGHKKEWSAITHQKLLNPALTAATDQSLGFAAFRPQYMARHRPRSDSDAVPLFVQPDERRLPVQNLWLQWVPAESETASGWLASKSRGGGK